MEFHREEAAKKSMAEAEERFKSDDLLGAIQLAKKAQSLYPSLHLSNFIVALRILSTAASTPHPSSDSFHHAILGTKPTDTIEAIKHKYRKLCIQTHPDKNPSPAADPAFKLVHQAWDALKSKPKMDAREDKRKAKNTADSTEYYCTNLQEAKKAMAEAAERFKANQLVEAVILAQKAKTLYPFLPHLDSFLVALRVVLTAGCMPRNDSLWHAILGSNSTDCFEVVKNKYRELRDLTNPDRNLNAAAEAAFWLVNQAWDALKDRVRVATVNANYVIRHPYGILPPPPAPLSAFLRTGTRAGADGRIGSILSFD